MSISNTLEPTHTRSFVATAHIHFIIYHHLHHHPHRQGRMFLPFLLRSTKSGGATIIGGGYVEQQRAFPLLTQKKLCRWADRWMVRWSNDTDIYMLPPSSVGQSRGSWWCGGRGKTNLSKIWCDRKYIFINKDDITGLESNKIKNQWENYEWNNHFTNESYYRMRHTRRRNRTEMKIIMTTSDRERTTGRGCGLYNHLHWRVW